MTVSYLFNIKTVNTAGTTKLTNRISIDAEIAEDATLAIIRQLLVSGKKLDSAKARFAFCGTDGARVGDDFNWSIYKALVENSSDNDPSKNMTDKSVHVHDVYFELPEKQSEEKALSKQAQDLLDSNLDMDLVLITATLKELASTYNHNKFKAASGGDVMTASSLSEEDWEIVVRNTHFLNGNRIVFSTRENGTKEFKRLDRAPFSAFSIAPRKIFSSEKANKSITVEEKYRIPRYIVTDDSYVNVFETANSLSESVASSSFSQMDIEASTGGSLFGASLSVKAGFSQNESTAISASTHKSARSMNITYNFPRAILSLDSGSLELTNECKADIDKVTDHESLLKFHHKYGHFFATTIELGGKLFASERFTTEESTKAEEKANAMKVRASASFSYGAVQASASYSQETQRNSARNSSSSQMTNTLTWEARGGDTILCNDPPNWCPTVKPFSNWRVINQKDVMPLADFIATFPDYINIPDKFDKIRKETTQIVRCNFRLKTRDDELCGLCVDETGQILANCLNHYKAIIRTMCHTPVGPLANYVAYPALEQYIDAFISHAKGDDFTVDFRRYVGIRKPDKHCNFQVEVLKKLDTQSQLQFNVPYLIYSPHLCAYLAADTPISVVDVLFGYLFYTERARASRFMFREVGDIEHTGIINNNTEVQLTLCNDAGGPSGVVKRSKADPRALVLDKDGNVDRFGEKYSPRLEYIT